jgi:hypothetical protein
MQTSALPLDQRTAKTSSSVEGAVSANDNLPCETHEDSECHAGSPQVIEGELFAYAVEPRIYCCCDRGEDPFAALGQTKER